MTSPHPSLLLADQRQRRRQQLTPADRTHNLRAQSLESSHPPQQTASTMNLNHLVYQLQKVEIEESQTMLALGETAIINIPSFDCSNFDKLSSTVSSDTNSESTQRQQSSVPNMKKNMGANNLSSLGSVSLADVSSHSNSHQMNTANTNLYGHFTEPNH